jgi:hypothetical protein
MGKIHAVITGVGGYVPDYVLNNEELSRMVDTSDEWIMTRVGIKERHILTEDKLHGAQGSQAASEEDWRRPRYNRCAHCHNNNPRLQVPFNSFYRPWQTRTEERFRLRP